MIGSSELMDALRGIGLNLYERKLWVALLSKGIATAGELASAANVPRSRTYDVLESLENKGFVVTQPSKPLKFVALPPEEALMKVKEKEKEKIKVVENKLDKIRNSKLMEELKNIHEQGRESVVPGELSGSIKGGFSVTQQFNTMLKSAKNSVNVVTTPEGVNQLFENHLSTLKKLKKAGVDVKIATDMKKSQTDAIKALSDVAEIRHITEELPLTGKFYIIDENQVMMGLSDPQIRSTQETMFWTKSSHAAKNMVNPLFNLVWEKAIPKKK